MIAQQRRVMTLGSGVAALALTAILLGGSFWPPALARPPATAPPPVAGRYQISSFVIQRGTPGAYILDTQTGEVFQMVGRDTPVRIGSVATPLPRK